MYIVNGLSNSSQDIREVLLLRRPLFINLATSMTYNTSCISFALHIIAINVHKISLDFKFQYVLEIFFNILVHQIIFYILYKIKELIESDYEHQFQFKESFKLFDNISEGVLLFRDQSSDFNDKEKDLELIFAN